MLKFKVTVPHLMYSRYYQGLLILSSKNLRNPSSTFPISIATPLVQAVIWHQESGNN